VLSASGVPTPAYEPVPEGDLAGFSPSLPFPLVVKPCRGGSSIGVNVAKGPEALHEAIAEARREDAGVYLEAAVPGREVTVSVLDGEALPIVEIVPPAGLFDFAAKYTDAGTRYIVPAELPDTAAERIRAASVATYRALGCGGAARVDLMLDDDLEPYVLEINTVPGLTPKSLLPKAAGAIGIGFTELIGRMLAGARLP
jgi:D-alanine-D-alanine ligase